MKKVFPAARVRWFFLFGCAALMSTAYSQNGPAVKDDGKALADTWYALALGDAQAGYMHTLVTRVPGEPAVIRSQVKTQFSLSRAGQAMTAAVDVRYDEDEQGRILGFSSDTHASALSQAVKATVHGDKLLVETPGLGPPREQAWDGSVVGPWAADRRASEMGIKPGLVVTVRTFDVELFRPITLTVTVKDKEEVDVAGKKMTLWRTESTQDAVPGVVTTSWVDNEGVMVKSFTNMLFMTMTLTKCSREEALGATGAPELFMKNAVIRVSKIILNPRQIREATYRITFDNPLGVDTVIEDARQKIVKREGNVIELRVRTVDPPEKPEPQPPAGFEKYLQPSAYLQSDDPAVLAAAKTAAGDEKDPWKRAKRLEKWVLDAIEEKDLSVGFASAKETLDSRTGDCTEHSVLLAALLRAVGSPSRVAFGLVYVPAFAEGGPIFGAHMWTEVWVGGWIALDATLAGPFVDAMHVKLGESALDSPSPGSAFLNLIHVLGQTSIEIVSVNAKAGE